MSGSVKISDDEKKEMIEDSKNYDRGKVFNAARILSQKGSIDDYIDFCPPTWVLLNITQP